MKDIEVQILKIIASKLRNGSATLSRSSKLDDLGIESLDVVEIIFEIEEQFDILIPYNANRPAGDGSGDEFGTVESILDAVTKLITNADAAKSPLPTAHP